MSSLSNVSNQKNEQKEDMKLTAMELTRSNFEQEVLNSEGGENILVDFWAPWCTPCKMQGPIVEELAGEGYHVGKVNIQEERELAARFQVMSIPTLLVFRDGKEVDRLVGLHPKNMLEEAVAR